jgi:hypothetical protein
MAGRPLSAADIVHELARGICVDRLRETIRKACTALTVKSWMGSHGTAAFGPDDAAKQDPGHQPVSSGPEFQSLSSELTGRRQASGAVVSIESGEEGVLYESIHWSRRAGPRQEGRPQSRSSWARGGADRKPLRDRRLVKSSRSRRRVLLRLNRVPQCAAVIVGHGRRTGQC